MSTPGVDGIYIGPADLSLAIGEKPGFDRPESTKAYSEIRIGLIDSLKILLQRPFALAALALVGSGLKLDSARESSVHSTI